MTGRRERGTSHKKAAGGAWDDRAEAVAALAAHVAELDEALRTGADAQWDDITGGWVYIVLDGRSWNLWRYEGEWTAVRAEYEAVYPGGPPVFGEGGDLIGTVGPATLSPEEIVRRLLTLEFDSFEET